MTVFRDPGRSIVDGDRLALTERLREISFKAERGIVSSAISGIVCGKAVSSLTDSPYASLHSEKFWFQVGLSVVLGAVAARDLIAIKRNSAEVRRGLLTLKRKE